MKRPKKPALPAKKASPMKKSPPAEMALPAKPKLGYIGQAWLVILLAVVYGGTLAGVQATLGPVIAANRQKEAYAAIPSLVPGAERIESQEVVGLNGKSLTVYKVFDVAGAPCGWVLPASGQGFADRIDLLLGVDATMETMTGLYVLDQKETPGLGDMIRTKPFSDQFHKKQTHKPVTVVQEGSAVGNQIRAITGATISSDSVATIVNQAFANLRKPIRELAGVAPDDAPTHP